MASIFRHILPKTKGAKTAAGSGIFVEGAREIDAILSQVEPRIAKKLYSGALKRAAQNIILPEAKDRVPVDSGDLEDSLVARAMKRSRTRFGWEVRTREGFFKGEQYYGGFQEFGTKTMRAQPFLRPAGYGNEQRIRREVIDDIKKSLRELPVSPVR